MKKKKNQQNRRGFSLIELMVVITIIGLLSAVALVSYGQAQISTRNGVRKSNLEQVKAALVSYRTDNTGYPAAQGTDQYDSYTQMMVTIQSYVTNGASLVDPKNTGVYRYSYSSSSTKVFQVCAALETAGTSYCVSNP
jgi:prepilin-type N-terminal cleavage/methylation domain-containing protein